MQPRARGRPRVDEDDASTQVCVTLPGKHFDDYCARARREGESIPALIRRDLRDAERDRRSVK